MTNTTTVPVFSLAERALMGSALCFLLPLLAVLVLA